MTEEMLEILIGKFLDSEITAGERRMLDAELERNAESRRLFEGLQRVHDQSRGFVETAAQGKRSAGDVFEQAWEHSRGRYARGQLAGWRRFAAGVAAGLIIATAAFSLMSRVGGNTASGPGSLAVAGEADAPASRLPLESDEAAAIEDRVIRQVDLYDFRDDSGGRWLVEGLRERRVRPAIYYQDL